VVYYYTTDRAESRAVRIREMGTRIVLRWWEIIPFSLFFRKHNGFLLLLFWRVIFKNVVTTFESRTMTSLEKSRHDSIRNFVFSQKKKTKCNKSVENVNCVYSDGIGSLFSSLFGWWDRLFGLWGDHRLLRSCQLNVKCSTPKKPPTQPPAVLLSCYCWEQKRHI
jgi:hypothetical protein